MPAPLYKLLLVDDEEAVRRAVIDRLDWAALGFCVVGEAANGQEALELAERLKPDVVMTDIRMPFMDGLELCRQLKRLLPATRIAILTGFDEFEYAREAITQQVEDYILKPVDAGELASIFTRIRQSLDQEIARHRDIERLRRLYAQSLPTLQKQALLEWLTGGLASQDIPAALSDYGLDITAGAYCAACLRFESDATDERRLLASSLSELASDTLPGNPAHFVLQPPGRIAVIFLLPPGTGPQAAAEALQPLFALAHKLLGVRLHIGLGKAYTRPEDLARSYAEAEGALAYQFLLEPGQCVFIGDIEPGSGEEERLPDPAYADALFRQIKTGSSADLQAAVDSLIAHLKSTGASPQQYQIFLLELFTGLLKIIRTYQMDEKESHRDVLLSEGLMLRLSSLSELRDFLLSYCNTLRRLARQGRRDSLRLLIDRAKDLIHAEYADPALSLETVCSRLGVSAAYFSTVFKKETGQGFIGYLTAVRMEKALELLHTTDEKTYRIAERVGYLDPNYFSYVFKKQYGASPSRVRAGQALS